MIISYNNFFMSISYNLAFTCNELAWCLLKILSCIHYIYNYDKTQSINEDAKYHLYKSAELLKFFKKNQVCFDKLLFLIYILYAWNAHKLPVQVLLMMI